MSHQLSVAIIFIHALCAYGLLAIFFTLSRQLPPTVFTIMHYVVVAVVMGMISYIYFNFFNHFEVFLATVFFLLSIFVIEFIVYTFIYNKDLWFLNPLDWIGSIIIAGVVVFAVGRVLN